MAVRAQLRARRTGSRSGKFFQGGLGRAVAAAVEPLERRVMLSAAFDTVPPSQPTNLTATPVPQYTDSELQVNWAASTDNVAVTEYEIFRNLATDPLSAPGVQVGAEPAGYTQFVDTGLNPSTSYRYTVVAFDAADNQSSPATVTGTTGADSTAPDAPLDLQVTSITPDPNAPTYSISLSWVQPWDNVGVSGYNVTWSSNASPPATGSSNPLTPSVTFSGLAADTSYTFDVTAYDAAQKVSGPVSITASTPQGAAEDQSPNQYVPQAWQDYFYNSLTAVLRQKVEALPGGGGSTPAAAGWLDRHQLRH